MKLHKLSATSSTNDYLKELLTQFKLENYTVVVTDYQVLGKGQGMNKWHSEKGKNLLFSVLIKFDRFSINKSAYLNFAITLGIYQVLSKYIPQTKIKWPNDIMAENKKICGVLIENSVGGSKIKHSIVGIGLNVNQLIFPKEIPNATSFNKILNTIFDRDKLQEELIIAIKKQVDKLVNENFDELKRGYESVLFKKNILTIFKNKKGDVFNGIIIDVSKIGLLRVKMPNNSIEEFANKELVFIL